MQYSSHQLLLRRTKIIATLGPATDDPEMLKRIIAGGVNLVRLNFSHGSHAEQQRRIESVRQEAARQDRVVGILADLQGPKIRVANFQSRKIFLNEGDHFALDANWPADEGNQEVVGIDYKELPRDVGSGDILLLDDGRITLKVLRVDGPRIHCEVKVGGELSNHKGINRKGGGLSAAALTDKDKEDLSFVMHLDVDYVAISFPRNAEDIHYARRLMAKEQNTAGIIAKIERTEAVTNIHEILEACDGVMVARGDLAVEIGDAEVPLVQKDIIRRANALDKPVIIATQMMESMVYSTVPTRAEVSDVANAVLDSADAVMLSAETAVGNYPDKVVEAMVRVCIASEKGRRKSGAYRNECRFKRTDEAIAMASMYTANHLDIKAVMALTESGATTLWMSRISSHLPIYGLSRNKKSLGRMTLYRGVYPTYFDVTKCHREEVNRKAIDVLEQHNAVRKGDLVILTKGDYLGVGGGSNAMKILRVGEVV